MQATLTERAGPERHDALRRVCSRNKLFASVHLAPLRLRFPRLAYIRFLLRLIVVGRSILDPSLRHTTCMTCGAVRNVCAPSNSSAVYIPLPSRPTRTYTRARVHGCRRANHVLEPLAAHTTRRRHCRRRRPPRMAAASLCKGTRALCAGPRGYSCNGRLDPPTSNGNVSVRLCV